MVLYILAHVVSACMYTPYGADMYVYSSRKLSIWQPAHDLCKLRTCSDVKYFVRIAIISHSVNKVYLHDCFIFKEMTFSTMRIVNINSNY